MFTIEHHVGRLVELRMYSPLTIHELEGIHTTATRVMGKVKDRAIVCTDLLGARVFPQPVTDRLIEVIRQETPRVERNAFLVSESAVFSMQIERILHTAGAPNRRSFRDSDQLVDWLDETLNPAERKRLERFLSEGVFKP